MPLLYLIAALSGSALAAPDPRLVVDRAITALGGEAALTSIERLHIETIGHDFYIEQSERPEGPYIAEYQSTIEDRDVAHGRSRLQVQRRSIQAPDWTPGAFTVVNADAAAAWREGHFTSSSRQAFEEGRERIELAPERVLLYARSAADLTAAPDDRLQGVLQHVVTFEWHGHPVRLFVNAFDDVPTALEVTAPDQWGIWGDVRSTTLYSLWTLLPGGVRYPLQLDREWNGVRRGSTTIVRITANQPQDDAVMAIPEDVKRAYASAPVPGATKLDPAKQRHDVVPGVAQYAGSWNVEVVQQPDGLVVIEAPIGSSYSAQILDELQQHYPGMPIKAVVTTSDAWPHIGGVREYVARGIPVYALDLNRPIIERLLKADYASNPDALARNPRNARFTWVGGKTSIGGGDLKIELYPAGGENGERMMFAYFPALRLLYTSDDIQPLRAGGFFMPEYLQEVKDLVTREHLAVDRVFGMHLQPRPWSDIEAALAKATQR